MRKIDTNKFGVILWIVITIILSVILISLASKISQKDMYVDYYQHEGARTVGSAEATEVSTNCVAGGVTTTEIKQYLITTTAYGWPFAESINVNTNRQGCVRTLKEDYQSSKHINVAIIVAVSMLVSLMLTLLWIKHIANNKEKK